MKLAVISLTVIVLTHAGALSQGTSPPISLPPQVPPSPANPPDLPAAGSSCQSYGTLQYTPEAGNPNPTGNDVSRYTRFGQICPLGSKITSANLTSVQSSLAGINFTCDDAARTQLSVQTPIAIQPSSPLNTSSLVLADGESFGAASHYVGYVGYAIIPGLTLDSSNGQKVTAGSPSAKATSDIPFQIPSGATIVGIGGGQNGYFISLFLAFCAK